MFVWNPSARLTLVSLPNTTGNGAVIFNTGNVEVLLQETSVHVSALNHSVCHLYAHVLQAAWITEEDPGIL